jgi:hypothetical protein
LQTGLYEEEGRAGHGAKNTRCCACEDVDGKRLEVSHGRVCGVHRRAREDQGVHAESERLVEAETAAVERHLVDVLGVYEYADIDRPFNRSRLRYILRRNSVLSADLSFPHSEPPPSHHE